DLHGAHQLLAVEGLALTARFDHGELAQLDPLEGREPGAAIGALAPPADRCVVVRGPRVLDLGVFIAAERTTHGWAPPPKAGLLVLFRRVIDRESAAECGHFRAYLALDRRVVGRIAARKPVEHPPDQLAHRAELGRAEAARRRRRGAEANARGDRGLLRIEGDPVLVAGDAGLLEAVLGGLAVQLLGSEIDQHQVVVRAASGDGEAP